MRDILEEMLDRPVSRETVDKLHAFHALVLKWTKVINLISKGTYDQIWQRHILDSAQVLKHSQTTGPWIDLGSGGGFPGLVVVILAQEQSPRPMTLIESDMRKSAFLLSAARELDLDVTVTAARIEDYEGPKATTVSARALADLPTLIDLSVPLLLDGGEMLFLKGQTWPQELTKARESWTLEVESLTSKTSADSALLRIGKCHRV